MRRVLPPGTTLQRDKHSGEISADTHSRAWMCREYRATMNRALSYLYAPAGLVPARATDIFGIDAATDIWLAVRGAHLNLDDGGQVVNVLDAGGV